MDDNTHKSILKHYSRLFKEYGQSPSSVGWIKGKQDIRFDTMRKIGILEKDSVLDLGCGFGDLLTFFNKKRIKVKYTGIDINPKFIEIAKKKHPNAEFSIKDLEKKPFKKKFDWVFAIGTTNQSGSYLYIQNLMNEMSKISKKGFAMDFLSTYVDFKKPGNFHASPEKIFGLAKKISKRVVLKHDYLPFEFCVYVYKNDKITKNLSFTKF